MVPWKQWLEPGRRLLTMFLAVAVLLAGTLLWLGWQLARQDRELAVQRMQERREIVADLAVAALQKSLSQADEQLAAWIALPPLEVRSKAAAWAAALPADSILALSRDGAVDAWPDRRLAFYPVAPATSPPPASLFATADIAELRQSNYAKALQLLGELANSHDPAVRAAALVRIARVYRKQSQWKEALAAYEELSAIQGATIEGLPAELVARQARLSVFERQKQDDAARREAAALLASLDRRRWRLARGAYEFHAAEARRVLGGAGNTAEEALSGALESTYEAWQEERRGGRRLLREGGAAMLALWRGAGENMAAMVLGPRWIEIQWPDSLKAMAANQGVAIRLTDADGRIVLGPRAVEAARESVRLSSMTQLPWTLHAVTTSDRVLESSDTRRRLIITAVIAITLLILAGTYLIGRSVTRELAVSRLQSDFVSAVSHEFRTPLTSLCLLTEQLATGRVAGEAERAEYYGVLASESQRLRRLVEGLLNFGRMEAGAVEYRFETLDPAELVNQVTSEFERDLEPSGYHVETQVNGDAPLVRADRAALACAVWNLLDNAVKYSPACYTVWAEVGAEEGRAVIRVRDRGVGIPASEQSHIFEKFVRGEAAKQASIRGTGVGLAMVHHIVAAHRGEIRLESKAGEGSQFTLLLPAVS